MTHPNYRIGLVFAAFLLIAPGAQAIPKAAEHADDSVVTAADVAKPKVSKAKKPEAKKSKHPASAPTKKTHSAKHG